MRPMSDEEKQERIMQFLTQKRETFSLTILSSMVQGAVQVDGLQRSVPKALVETSVEMADALMQKLYPMPKEDEE